MDRAVWGVLQRQNSREQPIHLEVVGSEAVDPLGSLLKDDQWSYGYRHRAGRRIRSALMSERRAVRR